MLGYQRRLYFVFYILPAGRYKVLGLAACGIVVLLVSLGFQNIWSDRPSIKRRVFLLMSSGWNGNTVWLSFTLLPVHRHKETATDIKTHQQERAAELFWFQRLVTGAYFLKYPFFPCLFVFSSSRDLVFLSSAFLFYFCLLVLLLSLFFKKPFISLFHPNCDFIMFITINCIMPLRQMTRIC